MSIPIATVFRWVLLLAFAARAAAQELVFDTVEAGRKTLATRDAFVERLGPFDRAARLKTNGVVSEATYFAYMAGTVRAWTPAQRARLQTAFDAIRPALQRLRLPLPARVHLIATTGAGEGNAAYTRGEAVILPEGDLGKPTGELRALLAHELFHVASRADAAMRDRAYAAIGFEPCGEVALPESLRDRRLTNPDAPANRHAAKVEIAGQPEWVVPVIYSSVAAYDAAKGGEFFDYLVSELLVVERTPDGGHRVPGGAKGRLVGFDAVKGLYEQIGRNTGYTIHPEEILADNFAILATGEGNVKSPEVLEKLRKALAAGSP